MSDAEPWGAAIGGGVVGARARPPACCCVAAPQVVGDRLVRQAMVGQPATSWSRPPTRCATGQYAPMLAANRAALETPFGSSWKGAAKPDVDDDLFLRLRLRILPQVQSRSSSACARGQGFARRLSRISDPRARQRRRARVCAGGIARPASSPLSTTPCSPPAGRAARASPWPPASRASARTRRATRRSRPKSEELGARRPTRRNRHAVVRRRRPGAELGGRLRCAQGSHCGGAGEGLATRTASAWTHGGRRPEPTRVSQTAFSERYSGRVQLAKSIKIRVRGHPVVAGDYSFTSLALGTVTSPSMGTSSR